MVSLPHQKPYLGELAQAKMARAKHMHNLQMGGGKQWSFFLNCHHSIQVWENWQNITVFLIIFFTTLQIVWGGGVNRSMLGGFFHSYFSGLYGNGELTTYLRTLSRISGWYIRRSYSYTHYFLYMRICSKNNNKWEFVQKWCTRLDFLMELLKTMSTDVASG